MRVLILTAVAVPLAFVLLVVGGHTAPRAVALPAAPPVPAPPDLTLGKPLAPPHTTRAQALALAEAQFGPGPFQRNVTISYGSFTDEMYRRLTATGFRAVGTRDVWKIYVTGLVIPRSCGDAPMRKCPWATTLSVFIDDKDGRYLEAVAH